MKPKLSLLTSTTSIFLILSLCATLAQDTTTASKKPASTGPGTVPTTAPLTAKELARATGLATVATELAGKDPNWNDPDIVLKAVSYDGLPISEVAQNLTVQFKNEFDVLLPRGYGEGYRGSGDVSLDWTSIPVSMRVQNVKASEVFNAMNLIFENNLTPLRWELKVNGTRRIALLRVLERPKSDETFHKPQIRRVYFVGDLLGDDQTPGMSISELFDTVRGVSNMAFGNPGKIQFHDKAQLLIVTGIDDEISFIQQTLEALRVKKSTDRVRQKGAELKMEQMRLLKAERDRARLPEDESKPKTTEPKSSSGEGGSK